MRDALAERLLAEVIGWSPEDVARERPDLQAMAAYKYDEYQQFSPGMRFVESLAIWLGNFESYEERRIAYEFIKNRLIFISAAEMRHLVSIAYSDYIRPILLKEAAELLSAPDYQVTRIANSTEFKVLRRKSLFLGLSDGAHIDEFRRASGLSNEQVHVDYRIEEKTAKDLVTKLQQYIKPLTGQSGDANESSFELVFLLNDFSASSDTLLKEEDGEVRGKVARAMNNIEILQQYLPSLVSKDRAKVFIILYVATETAVQSLKQRLLKYRIPSWPPCEVKAVYVLKDTIKVSRQNAPEFYDMLPKYYDSNIMDSHLRKGGKNVIYGYAACSLPVVLSHNAPNNSIYILWASKPGLRTQALFPRISRHREDI